MSPFKSAPLSSVCDVVAGQHIEACLYGDEPCGSPYLTGPADFGDRTPVVSKWTESPKVFAQAGDVLLTVKGAGVGKSNLGCDAAIGRQLMALRPRAEQLLQDYLFHFIRMQERTIARLAQGATVPGIGKGDVEGLAIPLLPLPEQRRIAAILDQAEALRAKRRAALAKLDTLAQSIFIEMFGDPVANPKHWPDTTPLGDVADIVSGVTIGRNLNGLTVREVPYLAVVNVQDREIRLDVLKKTAATEVEIARFRLQRNDLLLTEGGDPDKLGRGSLWHGEVAECIHQNHVFRVRLTSREVHPMFLNWLVGSRRGKTYFFKSAKQTTGIASINMTQLRGFPLLLPPMALQQKFAERMDLVDRMKTDHRGSLAHLGALFASLQHRAFRGEL